jgi:hypothetical protein
LSENFLPGTTNPALPIVQSFVFDSENPTNKEYKCANVDECIEKREEPEFKDRTFTCDPPDWSNCKFGGSWSYQVSSKDAEFEGILQIHNLGNDASPIWYGGIKINAAGEDQSKPGKPVATSVIKDLSSWSFGLSIKGEGGHAFSCSALPITK